MALRLLTPPTTTPLSLAEVKAHLRVLHSSEDSLISLYNQAATEACENWLGRSLVKRTYELTLDSFNDDGIVLRMPPIIAVTSVLYDDANGDEQSLTQGVDYFVDTANEPGWLLTVGTTGTWPTTMDTANAVRIQYTAGYVDSGMSPTFGTIPFAIKASILLMVGTLYSNRESVVIGQSAIKLPVGVEELMRPLRVDLGMA